jgi:hypothetical protein
MPDLWPFRPELGCSETLEWNSEVLGSRTGEQRLSLRPAPRQNFSYATRLLDEQQFARARVFARRNGATLVYVPVWGEQVAYGPIGAGATSLAFNTTHGDWRVGASLVVWDDDANWSICGIVAVTPTVINLTAPVGQTFTAAVICPLRLAYTPDGFNIQRGKVHSDISVNFAVTDNIDLSTGYATTYPQYSGLDVMIDAPKLLTNVSESIVRSSDYIDSGFGPVAIETLRNYADFGQTVVFYDERPELWKRRLWLHSLRGKQQTFWLPTFNRDLELQAAVTAASATVSVASIGEAGSYLNRHVMLETRAGARYFRQITNAAYAGGGIDTLTLSFAFGVPITPADVNMFCFISLVRLDADSVDIQHSYELCSIISIPVIEVPA